MNRETWHEGPAFFVFRLGKERIMSTTVAENEKREISPEKLDGAAPPSPGNPGDGMQPPATQSPTPPAMFATPLPPPPAFPAEIRAPAGTLPGVSAFQVR